MDICESPIIRYNFSRFTELGRELARMRPSARIRRAVPADAADIASVLRQSFLEFEALYTPKGFAATTPDPEQVGSRMEEGPAWIALCEARIAGTASAVPEGEKGLYVRGVAVVPSMRGRGIAEALMNEVESFARQNGCARMFLTTTPFLTSAIRVYEHFGFTRVPNSAADLFGTPLIKMEKNLDRE
jgi:GNAT superfamily N-acetyltransferase